MARLSEKHVSASILVSTDPSPDSARARQPRARGCLSHHHAGSAASLISGFLTPKRRLSQRRMIIC